MALSSIKLLNTCEWSKKLNFGRRSALGNFLEPAITSANTIMQTILGPPFAWPFNRVVTGFITTAGQQDYTVINWLASAAVQVGWLTVDDAGNSQQVTTAGTLGTAAPTWNHTKGGVTDESANGGTAVWTNLGSIGTNVSQTYSCGWVEVASVFDTDSTPPRWIAMESKLCLELDSAESRPRFISTQTNDSQGNITFRMMPVPDDAYPVAVTCQQRAPLFTKLAQTWAPIPDEYSRIYNWGFMSLMYLFADDARFAEMNSKFIAALLGSAQGLTETQMNIFLHNWQFVTGTPAGNASTQQQGFQARGT